MDPAHTQGQSGTQDPDQRSPAGTLGQLQSQQCLTRAKGPTHDWPTGGFREETGYSKWLRSVAEGQRQ